MNRFRPKQQQRPKKSTLIAGSKQVIQALKDGIVLDRIYVQQTPTDWLQEIKQTAAQYGVPIFKVPIEKINHFHIEGHHGCVGQKSLIHYYELQDIINQVNEKGQVPLFLILDGITDIRNIGAISRTAWCCGVHGLIIPDKGVGALNEDALLTSAGALESIPVCRVKSLMQAVDTLRLNGIKVYAAEMKAETSLFDCNLYEPFAVVLGGEEKGIYPALAKICDEKFSIPMHHQFESLNVSVAGGMILCEAMRQRRKQ
ncbi:MAG: 23S rRNA (guanosine(2251)-2'-O)-methyltransferase RlmB [Bacteroidetes bacterium]|nr:23S rRNA (guanosine(2251)-2'-O)-methyltransferase RlmB [Bacteroidota bacterium]